MSHGLFAAVFLRSDIMKKHYSVWIHESGRCHVAIYKSSGEVDSVFPLPGKLEVAEFVTEWDPDFEDDRCGSLIRRLQSQGSAPRTRLGHSPSDLSSGRTVGPRTGPRR